MQSPARSGRVLALRNGAWGLLLIALPSCTAPAPAAPTASIAPKATSPADGTPHYSVDASWPRALPNQWLLGQVSGIAVDARDHIWLIHRPRTLSDDERGAALTPPRSLCCIPAPPVLELDASGNVLSSFGGPGAGYDWPLNEHGIHVDYQGNVWIAGNDKADHQILKFSAKGQFLLQIGKAGQTGGSNDTALLGRPAHMEVDPATNELFVADGYLNRRIIVFDAATGAYKRHWGAYGHAPSDDPLPPYSPSAPPSPQFGNPHCVRLSRDGLVYVCDRPNDRIQVFRKDGSFVKEYFVAQATLGAGSVWDLALSKDPAQKYLYVVDGQNNQVWALLRETGSVQATFGRAGRNAGQFRAVHNVAIDSQGNLYTAEVDPGRRVQKLNFEGFL
jgi:DNA-binding beta-propeller fold protein YncE